MCSVIQGQHPQEHPPFFPYPPGLPEAANSGPEKEAQAIRRDPLEGGDSTQGTRSL
jgi:hypothetical protein